MVCDINRLQKPAVLTQPKEKPEVVSMDENAQPQIEVVAQNDEAKEEAPAEETAPDSEETAPATEE